MRTEQDFLIAVLGCLNRTGVDYMLTGSMASNFWGTPRTTHDVDIVVVLAPDKVDLFVDAFGPDFFVQRESVRGVFAVQSVELDMNYLRDWPDNSVRMVLAIIRRPLVRGRSRSYKTNGSQVASHNK